MWQVVDDVINHGHGRCNKRIMDMDDEMDVCVLGGSLTCCKNADNDKNSQYFLATMLISICLTS